MIFKFLTQNEAYEQIVIATSCMRRKGHGFHYDVVESHPAILALNLNRERSTTSGIGISGEGEYSGYIVTDGDNGNYKVFFVYIDTLCPEDTEVGDITSQLGELAPESKRCDIRKDVTMAIIYYLEQFGTLPNNVLKHVK